MQFTTSCFNPSLWLHLLRRFWPLAAATFLLLLVFPGFVSVNILVNAGALDSAEVAGQLDGLMYLTTQAVALGGALLGFIAAELVFHHLHKRSELQFYLGLPLGRTAVFTSALDAALALVIVPGALAMLIHAACIACAGYGPSALLVGRVIAVGCASSFLFISLGALSATIAGNVLGSVLVYLALNFTVVVLFFGASAPLELLMPGIELDFTQSELVRWLTPVFNVSFAIADGGRISGQDLVNGSAVFGETNTLVAYAGVGIIVCALACTLYRIRKAESAGETVSFTAARIVCELLFALVVTSICTTLFGSGLVTGGGASAVPLLGALIAFAVLGLVIAEMIVRKTPRVFDISTLKSCAALVAALVAALALVAFDPLGRVSYVPTPAHVEEAVVTVNGQDVRMKADDACDAQQSLLDNREVLHTASAGSTFAVSFAYRLEDGSVLRRRYYINRDPNTSAGRTGGAVVLDKLDAICSKPDYAMQYLFGPGYEQINANTLTQAEASYYTERNEHEGDGDEAQTDAVYPSVSTEAGTLAKAESYQLFEAIRLDADKGAIRPISIATGAKPTVGDASFTWISKISEADADSLVRNRIYTTTDDDAILESAFVDIDSDMTHARDWLKKHCA